MNDLPRVIPQRLEGDETVGGFRIDEFWKWAFSNLLDNSLRGLFAEWLVAKAVGAASDVREEWAPYDVSIGDVKLEVKSSAYVQTWAQRAPSRPVFAIGPTRAWNQDTGEYATTSQRQANVYVFCLLAEKNPEKVDPLDLTQWEFFVLPTSVLDARLPTQKSISLSALRALGAEESGFEGLGAAIERAAS